MTNGRESIPGATPDSMCLIYPSRLINYGHGLQYSFESKRATEHHTKEKSINQLTEKTMEQIKERSRKTLIPFSIYRNNTMSINCRRNPRKYQRKKDRLYAKSHIYYMRYREQQICLPISTTSCPLFKRFTLYMLSNGSSVGIEWSVCQSAFWLVQHQHHCCSSNTHKYIYFPSNFSFLLFRFENFFIVYNL